MTAVIFFANKKELKNCFRDWQPVAQVKNRPVQNPHTGEIQMDWGPDLAAIPLSNQTRWDEIKAYLFDSLSTVIQYLWPGSTFLLNRSMDARFLTNHVQIEGLDIVKMAILYEILTKNSFNIALNAWDKPALINLTVEDESLFAFPFSMVQALSHLDSEQVISLAQTWVKTEEMNLASLDEEDTISMVSILHRQAIEAIREQKTLYFWLINDET